MAVRSTTRPLFFFFYYFFSFTAVLVCATYVPPASPLPPSGYAADNSTDFIRAQCAATRYPKLCLSSLSAYAGVVHQSPVQLACVATNVTLARLGALAARVAALRRAVPPPAAREAAALGDCADAMDDAADEVRSTAGELRGLDAADEVRSTAGELRGLDAAVGPEVAWRVSNAQTWMSAALTNEDTCADGFAGAVASPAMAGVCRGVRRVKQYTSNALALVNALVAS